MLSCHWTLALDFGSRTSSRNPIHQLDIVPESAKFCVPWNWSHKLGVGRLKLWEQAIKCIWEKVQLATKFGLISDNIINERADPEWIRMPCEGSSKRLDVNFIDLYYLHHIDSKVPIEINVHFQPSPLSPHDAFWKRVLLWFVTSTYELHPQHCNLFGKFENLWLLCQLSGESDEEAGGGGEG